MNCSVHINSHANEPMDGRPNTKMPEFGIPYHRVFHMAEKEKAFFKGGGGCGLKDCNFSGCGCISDLEK